MFRQIPWIDEKVYADNATEKTSNTQFTYEELFQKIIADFQFAHDVLPVKQADGGRANKIAAISHWLGATDMRQPMALTISTSNTCRRLLTILMR